MRRTDASARSLCLQKKHVFASRVATGGLFEANEYKPLNENVPREEERNMLLENKVAVIYGAGGPIGGATARAFAREGARVFLAGRTLATLDTVANEIRTKGGSAFTIVVDATDEQAVDS